MKYKLFITFLLHKLQLQQMVRGIIFENFSRNM